MAREPLIADPPRQGAWAGVPAAVRIGILYLASRVVTTAFLLLIIAIAEPGSRLGPGSSLGLLVTRWDAGWYWVVAHEGYPSDLPLTDSGEVDTNAWAFMPIYAWLARGVGTIVGSWEGGLFLVSFVAGYFACLVLYRLLRERQDVSTATWATLFFASGPLAALFHVGYAEALFLVWLFLALWCVVRRRYWWLYLLIPLMAYTRPGVLAFALFLALHGIHRWFTRRREPLRAPQIVHIVALGALAVATGFSWPLIASAVTGESGAYLATELAWRRGFWVDVSGGFVPFDGFVHATAFWFGQWGMDAVTGYVILVAGVIGVAALLLFEPHVRRLGAEVRLWLAAYLVYLLAVFFPQSSIFRLLLPLSPAWGAVAMPPSKVWRIGVLVLCLIGQWFWTLNMYGLAQTYWRIP
ncbi:MAG: mannosyltransferase family protein [Microbacterium sp.]